MEHASQTSGAKSATFQMRINPEVKKEAEELFAAYGLTLTDAVNVFLRQSLNTKGLFKSAQIFGNPHFSRAFHFGLITPT